MVSFITPPVALAAFAAAPMLAGGNVRQFVANLIGYNETPQTINSAGTGQFTAQVSRDGSSIAYTLSYRDLESVTQSHIHFGAPATSGGIVLFLCTNLAPPAGVPLPQTCPAAPATIHGTLTEADVIPLTGQGIESGAAGLAAMVKAMQSGVAYTNVHTTLRPTGEIRGALRPGGGSDDQGED